MTLDPLRVVSTPYLDTRVAVCREIQDGEGQWWLYYTIGADLSQYIQRYADAGYTLGAPETTAMVAYVDPTRAPFAPQPTFHRRPIVKRNDGPSAEEATAETAEENNFPTAGKDDPVSYQREWDGKTWLVYAKGPHLRNVVRKLWDMGKTIGRVEVLCVEYDDEGKEHPLLFRGKRCYRRLIVPKDQGCNPQELGLT